MGLVEIYGNGHRPFRMSTKHGGPLHELLPLDNRHLGKKAVNWIKRSGRSS